MKLEFSLLMARVANSIRRPRENSATANLNQLELKETENSVMNNNSNKDCESNLLEFRKKIVLLGEFENFAVRGAPI